MSRYAKLVRHIRISSSWRTISPFIYGSISLLLGDQQTTLFPALNTVDIPRIGELSDDHIQYLFLLPCPTISSAEICGIGSHESEIMSASLLHSIAQRSRIVKSLKLAGRITSTSLNRISRFEGLRTLQLDMQSTQFSREILQQFCRMNTLKRLSLSFDGSSAFPISSSPQILKFLSLQHLEIKSSAQIALMVLLYTTTPRLTSLSLHFTSLGPDASSPEKCLQRISDASRSLKVIQITSDDVKNVFIPGADLTCLDLCPFLQHICIVTGHLLAQTFLNIPGQWSSVKYMRLSSKKSNTLHSRSQKSQWVLFSLSHLSKILSLCPQLKTLLVSVVLDIGAAGIQTMESSSSRPFGDSSTTKGHRLSELVFLPFSDSKTVLEDGTVPTTSNAFVISRFIRCICPSLQNCDLSRLTDINRDWRDGVQKMVKEL